ncbi:MAG: LysE family translocator [Halopseudomonas aestusnigri]
MELSTLLLFSLALLISAGSPGPSIAALVARVLVRGWRDVLPFAAAMWVGEIIWLTCAIAGLAALAESFYWAFEIIKYCGVIYLGYLAWKMWTAPINIAIENPKISRKNNNSFRMFFAGMAVTLGNPKIMVFYLALLPTLIDLNSITLLGWAELSLTLLVILVFIDTAYIILAIRARLLLATPKAVKIANRVSAGMLTTAAAIIASR